MALVGFTSNSINLITVANTEKTRKTKLLRTLTLIAIGMQVTIWITTVLITVFTAAPFQPVGIVMGIPFVALCYASYNLAGKGLYRQASWLLVLIALALMVASVILVGTNTVMPVVVGLMLPIALAIVLMEFWEAIAITALCALFMTGLYLCENILKIYVPFNRLPAQSETLYGFFVAIVLMPIIVALLLIPLRSQTRTLEERDKRLIQALSEIEARQHDSENVAEGVTHLAVELRSTAAQQATSSQQQAATVAQVNVSLNELSATATNINDLAQQVSQENNLVVIESQKIEETAKLSVTQSEQGLIAVADTESVSNEVAELYQSLLSTMNELNAKSANTRRILELLENIAKETHLLSLNAAIEAAGAGEQGERFSVVAREVKSLAQRSGEAGREVSGIVKEIEGVTNQAMEVAENGFRKAQEMREVAEKAGKAISQMRQVSEESLLQANSISRAAFEARTLTEIIKTATSHQQSASEQVLDALNGLSILARQNAAASGLVSSTATNLEQVSLTLTKTLSS